MGAPRPLYYALAPTARRGKTAPALLEARVFCPAPRPARASHWPRRRSRVAPAAPGPSDRGLQPRSPLGPQADPDRAGAAAKNRASNSGGAVFRPPPRPARTFHGLGRPSRVARVAIQANGRGLAPLSLWCRRKPLTAPATRRRKTAVSNSRGALFRCPPCAARASRDRPDVFTAVAWPVHPPPTLAPGRCVFLAPPRSIAPPEEYRASHTGGALSPPPPRRPAPPPARCAPPACPPRRQGRYTRLPPSYLKECASLTPQPHGRAEKNRASHHGRRALLPRTPPRTRPRSPSACLPSPTAPGAASHSLFVPRDAHIPAPSPPGRAEKHRASHRRGA